MTKIDKISTDDRDVLERGERLVTRLRLVFAGIPTLFAIGYLTHTSTALLPTLYGSIASIALWCAFSVVYLLFVHRRGYYAPWISYLSIGVDVLFVASAEISLSLALPLGFVSSPIAPFYFVIIAMAALRMSRRLVLFAGFGSALAHLGTTTPVFFTYLPGLVTTGRFGEYIIEINYLDVLAPAAAMIAVCVILGHVTHELRQSRRSYRELFENVPDGIAILSVEDGEILAANIRFSALVGTERKDLLGQNIYKFLQLDRAEDAEKTPWGNHLLESPGTLERADGTLLQVNALTTPITYGGRPCIEMSFRDVTEQARLQRQLIQSQKMETLGRLAGGLAHDFNNILGGILGASSLVERTVKKIEDTKVRERIEHHVYVIRDCSEKARDVVSRLMSFSRSKQMERDPVDLCRIISDVATICRNTFEKAVTIETVLPACPAATEGDRTSLTQALLNLCINAKDAMPKGGTLTLVLRAPDETDTSSLEIVNLEDEETWVIEVKDTGLGIGDEILGLLFDPFFTTKPEGEGTGLGLAMVYMIVKGHRGDIDVRTQVGHGTSFVLFLPSARPSILPETDEDAPLPRGQGTVLVVDDEEVVRSSICGMLVELGYKVIPASNADEAMGIIRDPKTAIDLAMLDIIMPRVDGIALLAKIRAMRPELRALLMSGYLGKERTEPLNTLDVSGFLKKPFSMKELAVGVSAAMAAGD